MDGGAPDTIDLDEEGLHMPSTTSVTAHQAAALHALRASDDDPDRSLLLQGGWVVDLVDIAPRRADVLIRGGVIEAIAPGIAERVGPDVIVVDVADAIVMPGLVDSHQHAWEGALRGVAPTVAFGGYWGLTHGGTAEHFTPDDMAVGELMSVAQAINAGTTTFIDNSHNHRTEAHADATIEALRSTGIRAVFAAGPPGDGPHDDLFPDELLRLRDRWFPSDDGLVRLRAFDLYPSPDSLRWATDHGLGVAAELGPWAPAAGELAASGALGPGQAFNHCAGLTADTWRALADSGAAVNLVVRSDAQYGIGGLTPVLEAQAAGLRFGISSDNETAYGHDLFTEMRVLLTVQRGLAFRRLGTDEDMPAPFEPWDVLRAATVGGAVNAGLEDRIGTLEPGKRADVAVLSLRAVHLHPWGSAVGTIVNFATPADVDAVFVDGRPLKWGGELVGLDYEALARRAEASRERLLEAAGFSMVDARAGGISPPIPPGF